MFLKWRITLSDGFSFGFLIIAIISVFTFEMYVVLPTFEEGFVPKAVHILNAIFILTNILGNLFMVMWVDTSTKKVILPSLLKPMWHFCSICEANAPPRTHHCDRCNCCIFKRDHHCTFSACCIGLKNYRYFLIFLFYMSIGCFYASVFNMFFIWEYLGGFSLFSIAAHILPFVFWLFGYLQFTVFLYTMLSMLALVGFFFVANLFLFHVQNMLKNQTTFERNNGIRTYDLGWRENIVQSLGKNWYKSFILPIFASHLPSDGLSFPTNEQTSTPSLQPLSVGDNIRQRRL
ncbi:probable palmitoyltransferase ZDHHC24 [Argiope bruennichi]|uniref:Palmitoyltransferase n=1 Tax=Argiope bruennichi TaxID=94029 RepID=A0A8T0FDL6_ARGBR|nr:probable palmitoyltransferase ZDHHC24 [Argiope bruennichi]KAF8787509.1 putative palmitoyltransferase ZDHHC24 like protein [Argiope bruennichi]